MNSNTNASATPLMPVGLENVNWYEASSEQAAALVQHRGFIPDDIYPAVQGWMNSFTADFIVTRSNDGQREFLLVRRGETPWKGEFFVPGGRIRPMETPTQACIRNVKRELGFGVQPEALRFVGFVPVLNPESQTGGAPWFSTWCLHEVVLSSKARVILDRNGMEFKWFNSIQPNFLKEVKQGLQLIGGFPEA